MGGLLVAVAAAFSVWVTMASLPFEDQRTTVVQLIGGGAYLLAVFVAVFGILTGVQRVRSTVRQDRRVMRVGFGVGLALLAVWGIAGAITPDASLGGVSLARYGAGGQVGGWLDSPVGWGVILLGLVASFVLIAPSAAKSLVKTAGRGVQDGLRYLGREIQQRGPGVLAALARAMGRGFVALLLGFWAMLEWSGRELWLAFGVVGTQIRESRRGQPDSPRPIPAPSAAQRTASIPSAPTPIQPTPAWPPMVAALDDEPEARDPEPASKPKPKSTRAEQPPSTLRTLDRTAADGWRLPPIELLDEDPITKLRTGAQDQARVIEETLASFGVDAEVTQINEGPAITQFGVSPGWEVKTRQLPVKDASGAAVLDERGRPLTQTEKSHGREYASTGLPGWRTTWRWRWLAPSIRIEAPVPGQPIVGVEVPNADTRIVALRGLIESPAFVQMAATGGLPIALGRDVTGIR